MLILNMQDSRSSYACNKNVFNRNLYTVFYLDLFIYPRLHLKHTKIQDLKVKMFNKQKHYIKYKMYSSDFYHNSIFIVW